MIKKEKIKTNPFPMTEETSKRIETAAYFGWLDRERYAQAGDEFEDWIRAEKEVMGFSRESDPSN